LYPNDGWKTDTDFQNDCLAFTLFHSQNRISSKILLLKDTPKIKDFDPLKGVINVNHWIPFTETQINAHEKFESSFMTDFMSGKLDRNQRQTCQKFL
jgi:hypothetical protein